MNTEKEIVIEIKNFNGWYDQKQALKDINMEIKKKRVSAIIGPSGCGKSTLLRSINRINDEIPGYRTSGEIIFEGKNVYENNIDLSTLRKKNWNGFSKTCSFSDVYL
nr:ATP-binding cassette domain-containing protein [Petrotoga sp. 8T1HF07.NaAc.6.1]